MTAGHLQEKKGYFYIVLTFAGEDGKRKSKWFPTGLQAKGNKKRAEEMLMKMRREYVPPANPLRKEILFADYLEQWLQVAKPTIAITTYAAYKSMVDKRISPYFRKRQVTLKDLKPTDIQQFYTEQLQRVKATSVIHYHCVIHRALKYAVKVDLLDASPADKVERPKAERYAGSFYDNEEVQKLFAVTKGTKLEIPVFLGAFYGLRRSEVLGLKWNAIDFERETITIKHTVISCRIDGKVVQLGKDSAKSKASLRTLPLVPVFKEKLLALREAQKEQKRVCGKCYNREYEGYILVDPMGNLMKPDYITQGFQKILKKNGMRVIRFHDLRHSCASLLLANGVPMKQIQEWLGHSDFSTTANIYAHLDYQSKLASAQAMEDGLKDALNELT